MGDSYHKIMNDYECMISVIHHTNADTNPLVYYNATYESLIKRGPYTQKK